jgi:hypothetical protein
MSDFRKPVAASTVSPMTSEKLLLGSHLFEQLVSAFLEILFPATQNVIGAVTIDLSLTGRLRRVGIGLPLGRHPSGLA